MSAVRPVFKLSTRTTLYSFKMKTALSRAFANHAIILCGGGSKKNTEQADFETARCTYETLKASDQFEPNNIRVLYGDGANIHAELSPSFTKNLIAKVFYKKQIHFENTTKFTINNANTEYGFHQELSNINQKIQPGDIVFMFLNGHGTKSGELQLYGESDGITPDWLKQEVDKLPKTTNIIINLNSCYAGNFLKVGEEGRQNVAIFSSSTAKRVTLYKLGQSTESFNSFMNYFYNNTANCLYLHTQGSFNSNNHFCTDSLTDFVDSKIQEQLPLYTKMPAFFINRVLGKSSSLLGKLAVAYVAHETLFFDSMIPMLLLARAGLHFLGNLSLMATYYSGNYGKYLEHNAFFTEATFANRAEKLYSKSLLQELSEESRKFLLQHQDDLAWILANILKVNAPNCTQKYVSLYLKTVTYLSLALKNGKFDEIKLFIDKAKLCLDPLGKLDRDHRKEKSIKRLISRYSMFRKCVNDPCRAGENIDRHDIVINRGSDIGAKMQ